MTVKEQSRFEPIALQLYFGDGNKYDRTALRAYKCENELKKAIKDNKNKVKYYLYNRHGIPFNYEVKVSEPGETPIIEQFTIMELINDKLTSCDSKTCLSTYEIYRKKGILEAMSALHLQSNLTII